MKVAFRVLDEDGEPVEGAKLRVYGHIMLAIGGPTYRGRKPTDGLWEQEATTDAQGRCLTQRPPDTVMHGLSVTASKDGLLSGYVFRDLYEEIKSVTTLVLRPPVHFRIRVLRPDGTPIRGLRGSLDTENRIAEWDGEPRTMPGPSFSRAVHWTTDRNGVSALSLDHRWDRMRSADSILLYLWEKGHFKATRVPSNDEAPTFELRLHHDPDLCIYFGPPTDDEYLVMLWKVPAADGQRWRSDKRRLWRTKSNELWISGVPTQVPLCLTVERNGQAPVDTLIELPETGDTRSVFGPYAIERNPAGISSAYVFRPYKTQAQSFRILDLQGKPIPGTRFRIRTEYQGIAAERRALRPKGVFWLDNEWQVRSEEQHVVTNQDGIADASLRTGQRGTVVVHFGHTSGLFKKSSSAANLMRRGVGRFAFQSAPSKETAKQHDIPTILQLAATGSVCDEDSRPIANATVHLRRNEKTQPHSVLRSGEWSTTTNEDGSFSLYFPFQLTNAEIEIAPPEGTPEPYPSLRVPFTMGQAAIKIQL